MVRQAILFHFPFTPNVEEDLFIYFIDVEGPETAPGMEMIFFYSLFPIGLCRALKSISLLEGFKLKTSFWSCSPSSKQAALLCFIEPKRSRA